MRSLVLIVAGLGAEFLCSPPLVALQAMVSQEDTATATATLGFVRNLATILVVVISRMVFQNGMVRQIPELPKACL